MLDKKIGVFDTHTHSTHSPDSRMSLSQGIEEAIRVGLAGIIFTDHYDIDVPEGVMPFDFDPIKRGEEIDSLTAANRLEVLKGIELGLQPGSLEKIASFASMYEFDTIIASVHFVRGIDPYSGDFYSGLGYKEAYSAYLEEIFYCITRYGDFDILGHFDYIARYAPYDVRSITLKEFGDYLEEILRYLAQNGKSLEINTNSYRERNGSTPILDPNILRRFRELGGEFLSIGSDAHDKERVGENFNSYLGMAVECGFNYMTHYKARKHVMSSLLL